jgi:hypothetical protein
MTKRAKRIIKRIRIKKEKEPQREWVLYCDNETGERINREIMEELSKKINKDEKE